MKDILYWLAATQLPGIGPVALHRWLAQAGDLPSLFSASSLALKQAGLTDRQCASVRQPDWAAAERSLRWVHQQGCQVLTLQDAAYPVLLREIHASPLVLYVQGEVSLLSAPQLAMVGSRHASPQGCDTARRFARELAGAGLAITSGLALGIDGASHEGALQGGRTIAVLGTGLACLYPRAHAALAAKILAGGGAIISELPPMTPPRPANFPLRNRLISGLALGVLVVEAARRSGSLITARYALEQNREVFAIPGSIHQPTVRGCHDLIRQGARLVDSVSDVLEEIRFSQVPSAKAPAKADNLAPVEGLAPEERRVLQGIDFHLTPRDAIIMHSGLTAAEVSSILLTLELSGQVVAVPGGYVRAPIN